MHVSLVIQPSRLHARTDFDVSLGFLTQNMMYSVQAIRTLAASRFKNRGRYFQRLMLGILSHRYCCDRDGIDALKVHFKTE